MMDEFALIRRLTEREGASGVKRTGPPLAVGIGDDAAVGELTAGYQMVMSCDTMVQGIHFKEITMKPGDIGYKALASNVSDMAAMGALPRYALVSLSIPNHADEAWLERMYDGLYECANRYGVTLAGGDMTSTPGGMVLSVTVIGEVEAGRALLRSSAEEGDVVVVTGTLGLSAAGLDYLLKREEAAEVLPLLAEPYRIIVEAHQRPQPQVRPGRLLLNNATRAACNDISDGLASEAWEIAEASKCGLMIEEERLPLADGLLAYAAETGKDPLSWALYGGEDYKLLACIRGGEFETVEERFRQEGLPLFRIGTVTRAFTGVRLQRKDGTVEPVGKRGFNHFSEDGRG